MCEIRYVPMIYAWESGTVSMTVVGLGAIAIHMAHISNTAYTAKVTALLPDIL
jgi:hypothetical protein